MRKVTQKKIEKFLLNFYPEMEISQEEKNELYQLYLQLESMGQNMIICLAGIERQIFVFEEIYQDNVNYFRSFNINYSSSIFSNKLIRQYSFELLTHILIFVMYDLNSKSMIFFENKNPEKWAKKLDFYKSKLKKVCIENTYIPMTELLDKLFRILVTLHYNLEAHYSNSLLFLTSHFTLEEITLFVKVCNDKDGNYDESVKLCDFFFSTKEADKVISDYELAVKVTVKS